MSENTDTDEIFDDDYLYFWEDRLAEWSDGDIEVIWRLLQLEPGMDVLDVPCGHGRIANRLAARGARVTGLDISSRFLDVAKQDAAERSVDVTYVHGDMRAMPYSGAFDAVVMWGNSFGYFDDDKNRQVLAEAYRALRPGGRLLLDMEHQSWVLKDLGNPIFERDGNLQINANTYDALEGRLYTTRIWIRDGQTRSKRDFSRLLSFPELRDWLRAAGFSRVEGYAGPDAGPLTSFSDQLIVVATR
ncbi:MAG: class I SAM-dependent methyltransferase [Egibacteraceae bacterium]